MALNYLKAQDFCSQCSDKFVAVLLGEIYPKFGIKFEENLG
jgi:hypothetical protein